jgi:hypothetical protein
LEAKRDHDKVVKALRDHKQKMQNKFHSIHADISRISQCITEEGLSNLEVKLEELNRQRVEVRLGEYASPLDELSERIVAVRSEAARSSADSMPVTISSEGGGLTNTLPASALSISSQLRSDCGHDNDNLSIHVSADVADASKTPHVNEIAGMHIQCRNSFINELSLPKFTDCKKQNIMNFLDELDYYFLLKGVPEKLKLVMAMGSISDAYTKQWCTTMHWEFKDYDHSKQESKKNRRKTGVATWDLKIGDLVLAKCQPVIRRRR